MIFGDLGKNEKLYLWGNSNKSEIERKTRIKIKCVKTDERGKRKIIKPN